MYNLRPTISKSSIYNLRNTTLRRSVHNMRSTTLKRHFESVTQDQSSRKIGTTVIDSKRSRLRPSPGANSGEDRDLDEDDEVVSVEDDEVVSVEDDEVVSVEDDEVVSVEDDEVVSVEDDEVVSVEDDEVVSVEDEVVSVENVEVVSVENVEVVSVENVEVVSVDAIKGCKQPLNTSESEESVVKVSRNSDDDTSLVPKRPSIVASYQAFEDFVRQRMILVPTNKDDIGDNTTDKERDDNPLLGDELNAESDVTGIHRSGVVSGGSAKLHLLKRAGKGEENMDNEAQRYGMLQLGRKNEDSDEKVTGEISAKKLCDNGESNPTDSTDLSEAKQDEGGLKAGEKFRRETLIKSEETDFILSREPKVEAEKQRSQNALTLKYRNMWHKLLMGFEDTPSSVTGEQMREPKYYYGHVRKEEPKVTVKNLSHSERGIIYHVVNGSGVSMEVPSFLARYLFPHTLSKFLSSTVKLQDLKEVSERKMEDEASCTFGEQEKCASGVIQQRSVPKGTRKHKRGKTLEWEGTDDKEYGCSLVKVWNYLQDAESQRSQTFKDESGEEEATLPMIQK